MCCLAAWGIYQISRAHQNVAGEEATASMTAANLYNEFIHAENIASKTWVGKVIRIRGIIASVNESGNYISINVAATREGGINCSIKKKDIQPEKQFHAGDSITIKGKCTGFLMDVNMVDCVIEN